MQQAKVPVSSSSGIAPVNSLWLAAQSTQSDLILFQVKNRFVFKNVYNIKLKLWVKVKVLYQRPAQLSVTELSSHTTSQYNPLVIGPFHSRANSLNPLRSIYSLCGWKTLIDLSITYSSTALTGTHLYSRVDCSNAG